MEEAAPIWEVCHLNSETLFWASLTTSYVFVSFSLHELMTFCSRLQTGSQGCESRVRPFWTDAAPLAGERIHWNRDKKHQGWKSSRYASAGRWPLSKPSQQDNRNSITQFFGWSYRSSSGARGAGEGLLCAAPGFVEKHRAVTHSVHILCFSVLCVFVFWRQSNVLY